MEDLALQMSLIQKSLNPDINRKALYVFAGDHGIAAEGVSPYLAKVTAEMVKNILAGGAAITRSISGWSIWALMPILRITPFFSRKASAKGRVTLWWKKP
ncbi:MAG: nicotinate-nucleotide--dimethylbenzimidazole phosphoribosyltransferase [Desulfobacterales bacterium]